jgi:hypothetical protein
VTREPGAGGSAGFFFVAINRLWRRNLRADILAAGHPEYHP